MRINSMGWSHLYSALAATIGLLVQPVGGFATSFCVSPEAPYLPEADSDLRDYADLIRNDFEDYFRAVSEFTTCLTKARAEAIVEAEEVGVQYRHFIQRAEQLGIAELAAIPLPPQNATLAHEAP